MGAPSHSPSISGKTPYEMPKLSAMMASAGSTEKSIQRQRTRNATEWRTEIGRSPTHSKAS